MQLSWLEAQLTIEQLVIPCTVDYTLIVCIMIILCCVHFDCHHLA